MRAYEHCAPERWQLWATKLPPQGLPKDSPTGTACEVSAHVLIRPWFERTGRLTGAVLVGQEDAKPEGRQTVAILLDKFDDALGLYAAPKLRPEQWYTPRCSRL